MDEQQLFTRGNAKSLIPFIPRDYNVIVKMTHTNSILGLEALCDGNSKFKQTDASDLEYSIVAIGDRVENLEIGDKVLVTTQPLINIKVEDDPTSITSLSKQLKEMDLDTKRNLIREGCKWSVNDYGVFSAGDISIIVLK